MTPRRFLTALVATSVLAGAVACAPRDDATPGLTTHASTPSSTASASSDLDALASSAAAAASSINAPLPGTVPPTWLGTRPLPLRADGYGMVRTTPKELRERRFTLPDTVAELPGSGFAARIVAPAPADVIARSTWQPGCPVGKEDLAWVRLTFRGFDGARHTGELLLNRSVAAPVASVFRELWRQRFPLEEMRVTTRAELDAPPYGDGNDTSAFVCRPAVGSSRFSEHAYGLAVDVNPFQNPYTKGDLVLPELAGSYVDRDPLRPGMLTPGAIAAFARIGWEWGGDWHTLKDRHHFSLHNR
ncbi:M15 family metallopeptidase [Nocardioides jiangxiensis]|uniref:M15 family metallopeptidase n=1 Tax=Nocardioides jiangxiensis TaxID=3064524 RepID=A0ABT9B023_9ACTN|nr:M15 family metallopeptidase [Nocardioides sp. WY-20]MDO7867644.1 M15 family metallopeptidase [Nocardioides sp. WY-20]